MKGLIKMSVLQNLIHEDKTFSEAKFKAKVDNIFIQLYAAVMKQDLQKVKHFLSDEVYEEYDKKIKKLQDKVLLFNTKTLSYGDIIVFLRSLKKENITLLFYNNNYCLF